MLGHPKYTHNEKVSFACGGKLLTGKIYIIDKYGTFGDDSDVSYDIMVDNYDGNNNQCLYKHINEKYVVKFEN